MQEKASSLTVAGPRWIFTKLSLFNATAEPLRPKLVTIFEIPLFILLPFLIFVDYIFKTDVIN